MGKYPPLTVPRTLWEIPRIRLIKLKWILAATSDGFGSLSLRFTVDGLRLRVLGVEGLVAFRVLWG